MCDVDTSYKKNMLDVGKPFNGLTRFLLFILMKGIKNWKKKKEMKKSLFELIVRRVSLCQIEPLMKD